MDLPGVRGFYQYGVRGMCNVGDLALHPKQLGLFTPGDVREMLATSLALGGHRVDAVASGREALDASERTRPDVAIVDIGLPDMSGIDVARNLRMRYGPATRLVALSGFGAVVAGAPLFDLRLVKPVAPDELSAMVERLFDAAQPVGSSER